MGTPSIRELIESCPTVTSLPSVYQRLADIMNDPYSSAADFGAVVSEDSGLTARLLQLVNSAFYGFPSRIESVTQALSVVGTNQLHDLALATSVVTAFEDIPPELVDMESFWRHSLGCGVAAKVLGSHRREPNVERLFVAGLLHDIGRLIIYLGYPDGARDILLRNREAEALLHVTEQEMLGFDHAEVGRKLIQHWNLPNSLQEPIGFHHRPSKATRYPIDAALIHVGDIVAHALRMGNSGEIFVPPVSNHAWYKLGEDVLTVTMLNDMHQQYQSAVQAILQVEVA